MLEYKLFNRLPNWSQVEVLRQQGTVVARRHHHNWTITLYFLNNYFVELWTRPDLEIIGSFHASANPLEILEPYTENIGLQDLEAL